MAEEDENDSGEAVKADDDGIDSGEALKVDDDQEAIDAVYGVSIDITAVLGTSTMPIGQVLKLGRGAVVELERFVGEEIELFAEENLIAKGEVVVIDEHLAVSITKIIRRI